MTDMLQTIDQTLLLWIHHGLGSGPAGAFFAWITELRHLIVILVMLWLLILWRGERRQRVAALLIVAVLLVTDQLSSQVLKPMIGRLRPCHTAALADQVSALVAVYSRSFSFPSSHAANTFGAAAMLGLGGRGWWWLSLVPAALVGLSRVVVGVHYPSDVLGGALLGILCAHLLWWLAGRLGWTRVARGATLGMAGLCMLGSLGCGRSTPEPPRAGPPVAAEALWVTCADTVRRGDTFSDILLRNRLYLRDIEQVIRDVRRRDLFALRSLRPGELVEVSLDLDGRLRRLAYQKGPDEVYVLESSGDSLHAFCTGLPYETFMRKITATLETTVDEAIRGAGGEPELVLDLAAVFAYEIDFLTEPRIGDRIALLLEEKRYQGERVGRRAIRYARYAGKRVTQTAVHYGPAQRAAQGGEYYTPAGTSLKRTFLRSPLNYRRISSRFQWSRFHPIMRKWRPHLGVDYAAPTGTPVVAVGSGVVIEAGWNGGFGRYVEIRHDEVYQTSYGHLSRIARQVRRGQRVRRGQVIGHVGATGLATGPHLDFRVKRSGAYIDPLRMENPAAAPVPDSLMAGFEAHVSRMAALMDSLASGQLAPPPGPRPAAVDSSTARVIRYGMQQSIVLSGLVRR